MRDGHDRHAAGDSTCVSRLEEFLALGTRVHSSVAAQSVLAKQRQAACGLGQHAGPRSCGWASDLGRRRSVGMQVNVGIVLLVSLVASQQRVNCACSAPAN
ncbi:unnamed protein product [Prorocentrum cordatum]|uniref:Uncharacterized protein n=1 Tax=Prorocentrum cordatum TaxID=2364126 RepID=A0ABN9US57_9DINO|nr:unnamed protein product [Polarella glacialis]